MFLAGNVLQLHSHAVLSRLAGRSTPSRAPSKPRYRIPRGGAFHLVSCPHYFAEIVIYFGLALLNTGVNLKPWFMVAWVVRRSSA